MHNLIIIFSALFLTLLVINIILKKFNILIHSNSKDAHKKFGSDNVPLSGGLFFFLLFFLLYMNYGLFDNLFFILIFFYFILGLIVDFNIEINPRLRFVFQIVFTIIMVLFGKLLIDKTNLFFLDYLLDNYLFKIFFSSFCILVFLNGLNFIDGVNNNVVGFLMLIISSVMIIENKNNSTENLEIFYFIFLSLLVFYLFNLFNKSYLGDSGIYILAIAFSILIITFVNKSEYLSPFIAVNFLWYPAMETLFSIIRKFSRKKNPFKPDTFHLHTLVLKLFSSYNIKYANTLSGVSLNMILIPNFIIAINYYNHTIILVMTSIFYVVLYLIFYFKLRLILKD